MRDQRIDDGVKVLHHGCMVCAIRWNSCEWDCQFWKGQDGRPRTFWSRFERKLPDDHCEEYAKKKV
jgi:hypothetical protein